MAIFRGVGGSGDSSDNSFLQEVTAQATTATTKANEASASATTASTKADEALASANSAASSVASLQNNSISSAAFNTGDGVLTLTKLGGATVTADLDGRFLTSETDPVFTSHVAHGITATNISQWDTAYGWGDHSTQGYITNITTQSDPKYLSAIGDDTTTGTITAAGLSTSGNVISSGTCQANLLVSTGNTNVAGALTVLGNYNSLNGNINLSGGSITLGGTVDGRNVSTDGDKLDLIEANATADQTGAEIKSAYESVADTNAFTDAEKTKLSNIEASADVTDTVNVTAAGALMDSEVTNLAQVKAFDSSDYATAAQGSTADSALQNLVEDTSPQLGGQLDGQNNAIVSVSSLATSGNIQASTGNITTVTGSIVTTGGNIQATSGNITAGGNIVVGGTVDGVDIAARDAVLTSTTTTANSAMQDLVDDTTPQLGGDLDLNGNDITGTGNISITQASTTEPALTLTSTDDGTVESPTMRLVRNSASQANSDQIGQIEFYGKVGASAIREYAGIKAVLNDVTPASHDGQLDFYTRKNSNETKLMSLTPTALELTNGTDLDVAGDITVGGNIKTDLIEGNQYYNSNLNFYDTATQGGDGTTLSSTAGLSFKYDTNANDDDGFKVFANGNSTACFTIDNNENITATGNIAVTGTVNLNQTTTFGGNIAFTNNSHLMTVDGRDVSVDGARLDTIPYHRVNEVGLRTLNSGPLSLTTTLQNVGKITDIIHPSTPVDCSRYVDLKLYLEWRYVSSNTNDLELQAQIVVPANPTVVNMGTVTMISSSSTYITGSYEAWGYVSGDYTHHFTEFGKANKTGTANGTPMRVRAWQYDESLDRTYFLHDSNPGISFVTGDTAYWHPYDWESAGTLFTKTIEIDERYVTYAHQNESLKFKVAYDDARLTYRFKLRELSTTDSALLDLASVTFTDVGKV
jgi:hypothetical protein